jgi:hypothetical protein
MNQDCGLDLLVRLTGDMNIAGRMNGKIQPQDILCKAPAIF